MPAYEDVWYYLWKERRLPTNVDPLKSQLKDEEERARLARIFEQGLGAAVGYVLPLRRHDADAGMRHAVGERPLVPALRASVPDSRRFADRLRLPLDSLPWVAPDDYPYVYEPDLLCRSAAAAARRQRRARSS